MSSQAAVRRLRAGIVPLEDLESLSVGYGTVSRLVADRLAALSRGQAAHPLFVKGEWGSGKSHLLSFVRAAASAKAVPMSLIDLNARSAALNYPQRLYSILVENLRCGGDALGLRGIVLKWLEDSSSRKRLEIAASKASGSHLSWSVQSLIRRHENGDNVALDDSGDWSVLLGADLRWSNNGYKREQALARVEALAALLHGLGIGGLALVFDEAETIDQLWNVRSRLTAYGVLGRLCTMKAVWSVFGVTKRFDQTIAYDLGRDFSEYLPASLSARAFLRSWSQGSFEMLEPPEVDSRNARVLARSIARLYGEAYGTDGSGDGLVNQCVATWLQNPGRNPRRLIRLLVHQLDLRRPL
jgi:hypothetical protein